GWGPSNIAAQGNDAVKNSEHLNALAAQSAYATPQGQIHGSWWDLAKAYAVAAKDATTDDELKAALDAYQKSIDGLFEMSEEEKKAWSVIGSICGTGWDTDFKMTKQSDNVFVSEVLTLKAGEEFKVRQGAAWTVNFGSDGKIDGPNCVVEKDGKYIVKLTVVSETEGTIELVAAE
ncbi:MAG: SusF/SusE family outer membrane protein, partial [Agathobacter sp.]